MSLSHLGKFSEPVFDAALPAKPTIFPVARRVVSHAARSLFAGKLLFPVAIPGKEGQHCFASDPRRLFRMPRVKHSSVSVLPAVVSRTNHTFAPPPHAQIQPRQRLDFSPCKLPPRPELRPRAPASIGAPVLSLAEACAQPSIRLSRPPVKNLREPLYFQKCLISRFEISRLRRMAQASDWQSVSKPPADLVPASPLPEPWNWFALSARGRADRSSVMTRPLQAGPLDPPRPRLLYPTATRRPSLMPPLWKFLAHGRHAVSAWRPVCRLPTGPLSILSLQRRLPFAELLPEGPPPAPIDRDVYLSIYISDALSIRPHSFIAEFSHGRSRVRPAAHSGIAPVFHPDARLAAPTAHSGTVTEIITNIARARLADIRGVPPARLARKWPHAVFRPLRQLLFRKPFAKRFDFPPPEPPGFNVIAPRSFASLRPVSGDLRAAMKNEPDAARAKPAERRSRSSFSHSPMERFLAKTGLHLPDARVSDLRISAIQPAPVMCPGGATRKGVRQALGMPERRAVAEKALFTPREKQRTTFRTSAVPAQPNVHASELRVPVPAMQVLCLTAAPRGPRPLALPRRLPPAGEPERMLRLIASLPRRAHSTRHYLLTLESNLMPWKQRSQPRRTRVALPRELLVPRSPSFAREVMLPQDFQAVSPASKRAFLTTGISTAFLSLREAALPASLRIAHDRPRLSPTPSPPPTSVAGARFLDAPEWIRPARQPRMKIRYWPTFYELSPTTPAVGMRLSELGRAALPPAPASRAIASLAGVFGIRRRDRPRGPYSMRQPKRWLLKTNAAAIGVPDVCLHEMALPTTSPSRLDSGERHPPAFMGPAFRAPWTSVVIRPEELRQFVAEPAAPPPPERLPHCRATTRPATEPALSFQEAPMPRVITTARLSPLSPPGETFVISFGPQSFRPVGPAVSGARCEPPGEVRLDSLRIIEPFVELRPDLFADEFGEPAAGGGFFIRDLLCDLIVVRGDHYARWRSLFFPYKPDVRGLGDVSDAPLEPTPESFMQTLLDGMGPLELAPGILAMRREHEEPPTVRDEKVPFPFAPGHLRAEPFSRLPVLLSDVFGFDILEAPAAPAEEWDFSTSMYVPFIPAPLPNILPREDGLAAASSPFPQSFSEPVPSVSWPRRHPAVSEAFPSLEQPGNHAIIIAGRWNRKLPVDGGFRVRHSISSPTLFSGVHRLELPALPPEAFQALHIVDLAPATIVCHTLLNPVASPAARLATPASSGPSIPSDTVSASRTAVLPFARPLLHLPAGRYRQHEVSGVGAGRRISFRKQEFGFALSPIGVFPSLALPMLERKERRCSSKFKISIPGKAAVHPAAIPDWVELSSARPACRPPAGLQTPT